MTSGPCHLQTWIHVEAVDSYCGGDESVACMEHDIHAVLQIWTDDEAVNSAFYLTNSGNLFNGGNLVAEGNIGFRTGDTVKVRCFCTAVRGLWPAPRATCAELCVWFQCESFAAGAE